jgi:hypothetical protein
MSFSILNNSRINFKKLFNTHPFLTVTGLIGSGLTSFILLKSFSLASNDTAFSNYFMFILFFGSISGIAFYSLFKALKYDAIREEFSQMNPEETKQAINNLQKTALIYFLGIEKNLFHLNAYIDPNDTQIEKELKKIGAHVQVAKWAEAFYLKLESIKNNNGMMDEKFYHMVLEMQDKLKTKRTEVSAEHIMELEMNWQNQTQQAILDEIKRYSDYHFRNLEASLNKKEDKEEVLSSEGLFNSTKKYLKNNL